MIESELLSSAEQSGGVEEKKYAPPMWKEGFDKAENIAILSHVLPEELARQMTLLDQTLYRRVQGEKEVPPPLLFLTWLRENSARVFEAQLYEAARAGSAHSLLHGSVQRGGGVRVVVSVGGGANCR